MFASITNYFGLLKSSLYFFCNSSKQSAHKQPSKSSLTYWVSFRVSCTLAHWHLVNEFALHSNGALQRSQCTVSCFGWITKNDKLTLYVLKTFYRTMQYKWMLHRHHL